MDARSKAQSTLDSVRAAVADSTNRDALGYGLFINSEISTLLSVVEAADMLYEAIDEAHEKGETFPLQVSLWGARLSVALTHVKGKSS